MLVKLRKPELQGFVCSTPLSSQPFQRTEADKLVHAGMSIFEQEDPFDSFEVKKEADQTVRDFSFDRQQGRER